VLSPPIQVFNPLQFEAFKGNTMVTKVEKSHLPSPRHYRRRGAMAAPKHRMVSGPQAQRPRRWRRGGGVNPSNRCLQRAKAFRFIGAMKYVAGAKITMLSRGCG
jgi:hypothetical protein